MLKVVGIIGYKNSGKTTLTHALARELTGRGHEVAVIKHSSHHLDLPGKDTTALAEAVGQVGFISPQESGVFWKKSLSLENIIPYLEAEFILVEGFKAEKTFPKIVCLRGEPDDRDLFDGLAVCAVGLADQVEGVDVPLLTRDEVGKIADLVEEKAFKLPNLDCGGCGHERCYDMAREIVAGTGSVGDCTSLQPATEIRIDGRPMPMNPFISSIVRGTILGMLSPLKGFKKGKIEISI
ncbi:MAG: molybdopterin-guanine dinucleotide biosynthesis protein B [Chloroflexi bacterium]|nr:molybdopterin-guanine dinucleotide biosynthesis protein B [Chloroflexota bacterium]